VTLTGARATAIGGCGSRFQIVFVHEVLFRAITGLFSE
jgi:hypothetical protein